MVIGEGSIDYLPLLLNEQRIFSNTLFGAYIIFVILAS